MARDTGNSEMQADLFTKLLKLNRFKKCFSSNLKLNKMYVFVIRLMYKNMTVIFYCKTFLANSRDPLQTV